MDFISHSLNKSIISTKFIIKNLGLALQCLQLCRSFCQDTLPPLGAKTYFVRPATATGQQCFYAEEAKPSDPKEDTVIENPVSGGVSEGV